MGGARDRLCSPSRSQDNGDYALGAADSSTLARLPPGVSVRFPNARSSGGVQCQSETRLEHAVSTFAVNTLAELHVLSCAT